jgi:DNA-binding CsgD family transcriptional regulator
VVLQITPWERGALQLLATGVADVEIATVLHISEGAVNSYLACLFEKFGVTSRSEVVMAATRRGLVRWIECGEDRYPHVSAHPAWHVSQCSKSSISRRLRSTVSRCTSETQEAMSQKTVQSIIGRLVTDEEYRLRFLSDPLGALNGLRDQGVELTPGEIKALVRTDRALWTDAAERIDPHLQQSSLRHD